MGHVIDSRPAAHHRVDRPLARRQADSNRVIPVGSAHRVLVDRVGRTFEGPPMMWFVYDILAGIACTFVAVRWVFS